MVSGEKINLKVRLAYDSDCDIWDNYAYNHSHSTLYHLYRWKNVIEKSYGHNTYYLFAKKKGKSISSINSTNFVSGVLPLVHIKHRLLGDNLISIPFFDMGGILADDQEIETALFNEAIKLAQKLGTKNIELRNARPLSWIKKSSKITYSSNKKVSCVIQKNPERQYLFHWNNFIQHNQPNSPGDADYEQHITDNGQLTPPQMANQINYSMKSTKVRMQLELPDSSEELMKSFKSKLRSQIKKPIKEGLKPRVGGHELLEDFYRVFSVNMRDLGSPVHSKTTINNVLTEFADNARIVIIYMVEKPVACSVIIGFKDTLENPWASSLRDLSRLSPNMLLYWTMLEYACDNSFKIFNFGRSTPGEGTHKFKVQWGAKPDPLHWINISLKGENTQNSISEDSKFQLASEVWKKLPVPLANLIGPRIRKYIGL